ncbi:sensor histidine kinase [Microbispora cellulosiformans]|uniref:histidine kinase n=1 Tax=Microbispora cellulosiformans TaxID=2614688 RepID=A0A5J5K1K6_9ACTN|nr:sensor histidine kinase [Microbispora cellulosiformans]KAA9376917.1 sensor histidine kinase [Microbispora cellulosiformans]
MLHRRPPTTVDWLVAVVVGLFAVAEEVSGRTAAPSRGHLSLWIAAGLIAAAGVLFRRHAPFAILAVYSAANVALLVLTPQMAAAWQFYTQLVLLFTLLSEVRPRGVKAVCGLGATAAFVAAMLAASSPPSGPGDVAVALVMCAIAAGAGLAVRRHRALAEQAAERGELLAREAVAEERARIARELHDIVAHSVSVMTMQTGGVRLMLREDQERERQVLTSVEETGRGAVDELRRMLGLLRGSPAEVPGPRAGLDGLRDLLDQVRAAGLDVTLEVRGDPVPLPAGLDLSAYRIVQEALTNTLKHAGATRAEVTVAYTPRELRLDVVDHGPREGRARPATRGSGHGLIGMRERAALFRGTLTAAPLPSGGFGVRAVLPL